LELRLTKEEDMLELSTWFTTQSEVENWGGPLIRFPFTPDQFKKDIGWNIITSYSFINNDKLLGFVQVFDKYGYNHIGRVIIKPTKRANGLGVKLMQELFKKYINSNQEYSLFVYTDNINARKLYESLGFKISNSKTDYEKDNHCFFMKK